MHVLYSFPDGIGRPGIGTTAFHQVREVARLGVDVTLLCTSQHRELPDNVRVVETLAVAGRRVPHRVLGLDRSYRYHDMRAARALRRLGSSVDAVHCWPRATLQTARVAAELALVSLREVPNTHTAHAYEVVARELDSLGLEPPPGHSHTFDAKALAREEAEYEAAGALLVPSEYSLRTFVERGVPAEKLVLHRYGYEEGRFHAGRAGDGDRTFTAIFVGRCEPRKGLHHALRAWVDSGAADAGRFIICGAFEEPYRDLLAPLLAHPSVEVRGFVADPGALMRESDVFLFPSVEEGSALVAYEAQASGCVLLVSEATGARCDHDVDALVHTPGDVAALTEQLRLISADRVLLARMRTATVERSKSLTWAAAAKELAEIYEAQAAARPGRSAVASSSRPRYGRSR